MIPGVINGFGGGGGFGPPVFMPSIKAGQNLIDMATGVGAVSSIPGTRYGIVNGVVTQFAANVPPLEDKGLRGCPAFTQLVTKTRTLSDASWQKANGVTISGDNKIIYTGTGTPIVGAVEKDVRVPGGTASKVMMVVARVSADTYPQVFRLKNTHGAVVDNLSSDITITSPKDLFFRIVNSASEGNGLQIVGILPATTNAAFDIYAEINLAEANFIYPYTPNDTNSSVSVVSEAATASTGTSFDLDAATLSRLKAGLRGRSIPNELFNISNVVSGYINIGSTSEALVPDVDSRTTQWIPTQPYNIFDIVPLNGADRMNIQCKKPDGTIIYVVGTQGIAYRLHIPTEYTSFRVYYNAYVTINPNASLSIKPVIPAQGHIELEFESNVDSGWYTSGTAMSGNLITANNSDFTGALRFRFQSSACSIRLEDAASNFIIHPSVTSIAVGQTFKISFDYGTYTDGTQKMRLTVNGVKSSVVAFSGSFGTKDLRYFFGNTVHAGWIRNLKYYERPQW